MASKLLRRSLMKMFLINESAATTSCSFSISADNANREHITQAIEKLGPGNTVAFPSDDTVVYNGPNPEKAEKELATLGLQKISESEGDEDDKLSFDPETGENLNGIEEDDQEEDETPPKTDGEDTPPPPVVDDKDKTDDINEEDDPLFDDSEEEEDDEDTKDIVESLQSLRRRRHQNVSPRAIGKVK